MLFHAHQCVIALRTPFFLHATTRGFAESKDSIVDLPSHSKAAVWRFLKWCYTGDYPSTIPPDTFINDHYGYRKHSTAYFLADYLGTEELKKLAAENFHNVWKENWDRKQFLEAIRDVFANTVKPDDLLRRSVLAFASFRHLELKTEPEYRDVLLGVDCFAGELALRLDSGPNTCTSIHQIKCFYWLRDNISLKTVSGFCLCLLLLRQYLSLLFVLLLFAAYFVSEEL